MIEDLERSGAELSDGVALYRCWLVCINDYFWTYRSLVSVFEVSRAEYRIPICMHTMWTIAWTGVLLDNHVSFGRSDVLFPLQ